MLRRFRSVIALLDQLAVILSPLALLAFLVFVIIVLDGFGQQVNFLQEIERYGVDTMGIWHGLSSDGKLASIELPQANSEVEWVVVYSKHYRLASLAALREGQLVRVRYTHPPQAEQRAVLLDYYDEVRAYHGYFSGQFWPLFVLWGLLVLRPEVLYLGLLSLDEILPGPAGSASPAPPRRLVGPLAGRPFGFGQLRALRQPRAKKP